MGLSLLPGSRLIAAFVAAAFAALAALLLGVEVGTVAEGALAGSVLAAALVAFDYSVSIRAWRGADVRFTRRLPPALAIGAKRLVTLSIDVAGAEDWRVGVYDHADPSLVTEGLPAHVALRAGTRTEIAYTVLPTRRGDVAFAPADVRVHSRYGLCELLLRLGASEVRRVYPDFAQIARYAWLASDRRLQEIGIKTYQQRGEGTDFKQLAEYRPGDAVRHIDWKATLRHGKPIVRDFQDERDQRILLLIDCGRRMRADDRDGPLGTSHFDQVLNALMLLSYVALGQGDEVGALTFGTPPGAGRAFAPRKGASALNALMGELYAVQPTPTPSDYVAAAQDLLRRHTKRALVIVITNFRDEDSSELGRALKLLRSRHLVLLASLRERVVQDLAAQSLATADAAIDVASAHLYEQARRDAFNRLAGRDALVIDAVPERLGVALVNRYHAVKRGGLI